MKLFVTQQLQCYWCCRWWPGQICRPEVIPLNIRNLPHDVGQFAVYFFGTRDYLWTHHGRYDVSVVTTFSGKLGNGREFKKG